METLQRMPTPQASERLAGLHDNPAEPSTAAAAQSGRDRKGTPTFDVGERRALPARIFGYWSRVAGLGHGDVRDLFDIENNVAFAEGVAQADAERKAEEQGRMREELRSSLRIAGFEPVQFGYHEGKG